MLIKIVNKLNALNEFAKVVADDVVNIKDGGHFNSESGYGERFEKLLEIILKDEV